MVFYLKFFFQKSCVFSFFSKSFFPIFFFDKGCFFQKGCLLFQKKRCFFPVDGYVYCQRFFFKGDRFSVFEGMWFFSFFIWCLILFLQHRGIFFKKFFFLNLFQFFHFFWCSFFSQVFHFKIFSIVFQMKSFLKFFFQKKFMHFFLRNVFCFKNVSFFIFSRFIFSKNQRFFLIFLFLLMGGFFNKHFFFFWRKFFFTERFLLK